MVELRVRRCDLTVAWDSKEGAIEFEAGTAQYLATVATQYTDFKRIPELHVVFLTNRERQVVTILADGLLKYSHSGVDLEPADVGLELEHVCQEVILCFGMTSARVKLGAGFAFAGGTPQAFAEVVAADSSSLADSLKERLGVDVRVSFTLDWGAFRLRLLPASGGEQELAGSTESQKADAVGTKRLWEQMVEGARKLLNLGVERGQAWTA